MTAHICGTWLTHNLFLTLTKCTHRINLGS
jgi:hypothetical protein